LNLNHAATMRPKCLHATPKKDKTERISWNKWPFDAASCPDEKGACC
jgi:hypothetical protein